MTQNQVLRLLEKSKEPMSIKEIRKKLGIRSIDKNIMTLKKYHEIKYIWKIVQYNNQYGGLVKRPVLHYYV